MTDDRSGCARAQPEQSPLGDPTRSIDPPADESGVSRPSDGIYRRSPLGAGYDAFGSERYVLTLDADTILPREANVGWRHKAGQAAIHCPICRVVNSTP